MPNNKNLSSYNPDALGEVVPVRFYDEPMKLVLDYLNNDIQPTTPYAQYNEFKFFGRSLHDLLSREVSTAAKLILRGEEQDVEDVLKMIKEKPILLHIEVEEEDCRKRKVKGKLIQIAAMAGDVNLKKNIPNKHYCGIVERLIEAGNLSHEEVVDQLQCLTSEDAQRINDQRNQQVLNAIKKFGESIINTEINAINFSEYQAHCKPLIDELEKDLRDVFDVITQGYIFDPKILSETARWYDNNVARFGPDYSNKSQIFWINGFGKLQSMLSSRDSHIISYGFGRLSEEYRMNYPRNWDRINNLENLGVTYWLDKIGFPNSTFYYAPYRPSLADAYEKLMLNKKTSIQNLVSGQQRSCVIT